jgi:hypothetical protein
MMNVVSFKAPKFKPLPGELTPEVIRGATLPVKIGIAQRAIAACCDLSELLTWKDKLAALAAAAKMAKMPELSRDVNRVHKEAIFRMGEILLQYNGTAYPSRRGSGPSERTKAARAANISKGLASNSTRLAQAPETLKDRILSDDSLPADAQVLIRIAPRRRHGYNMHSAAGSEFITGVARDSMRRGGNAGFSQAARILATSNLDLIDSLAAEEKTRVRKLIVEMQEILDAMMQRLELAS